MAAQRDQIREWRESYARCMLKLDFKQASVAPFRASIKPILDGMRIVRTSFSPGFTFRDEELVKDGEDAFSFVISRSKNLDVTQRGRDLQLGNGDATLLRACATGGIGSRNHFEYIAVLIPRRELAERGARLDDAVVRRLQRRCETLQLLRGYLCSLEKSRCGASAEGRQVIRRHIIDLVALSLTPDGAAGESDLSAVTAARLAAILDCIATRFHEPELTVASVAHSQGISPRYLHVLMETSGTSFTERVNELRLQKAFTLLGEASDGPCRISDIALQAGFSDISYFNRLFRSRFGDTPSFVRAQAERQGSLRH